MKIRILQQGWRNVKYHLASLADPRDGPAQLHNLLDIVIIAVCAVICGANAWTEVEAFGHAKRAWLETFLELPHGIPAHDTFGRVFRYLDPLAFERCFREWTNAVQQRTAGQVIAFDGKCLRRSGDALLGKAAIYMVSAWATGDHVVLGQRKVDEKSNEITAIPALLQLLDVRGCIVSIDAIGTQKTIAAQIVAQGGDYMLAVKDNQPHLHEDVQALFAWAERVDYAEIEHAYWEMTNKGHGRIETRECWTISDPACLRMIADWEAWAQLQTVVRIRAQRTLDGQTSVEERYYISSRPAHVFVKRKGTHLMIEEGRSW